ncbi:hypothetical protein C3942_13540 [Solimonas fluminis]|uniref:OmpA-like domain-containing protein n=1 Tax=Solimonas fluminis TaxID=2086571 RepID=A0A2S5TEE6_9GAMM|nr:OmpA family protein [Solimonas fluminis]PPE73292.1 hypothetical protein C3942_13540 [Solimonas fluminis]
MKTKALALLILGGVLSTAQAESKPYLGLMGSWVNPDSGRQADDDGMGAHFLFGFPFNDYLAAELNGFGHKVNNDVTGQNDTNFGAGLDLKLGLAPSSRINPYLLLGGGATYEEALGDPPASKSDGNRTVGYANAGGGLLFKIGGSRDAALRIEGRRYAIFSDDIPGTAGGSDRVWDTRVNAGVQFNLSETAPPPPPAPPPPAPKPAVADSDGDGVLDNIDRCPGTPRGIAVDAYGCGLPPPPPPDADGDGVLNANDLCPDTPRGMRVDERGCAVKAQRLVLRNINFEFNKATLTADGRAILDGIAAGLRGQPTMEVEIEGHTDSIGSDAYNLKLSKARANSVRDYLVSQGVQAGRLSAKGMGESVPVSSNKTDEGRAQNRRVEFKVIKQ